MNNTPYFASLLQKSRPVYWMHEFERAAAGAYHIDDCGRLYECVFCPPHVPVLETMKSTCNKIWAMVGEKLNSEFMVFDRVTSFACMHFSSDQERRVDWNMTIDL